MSRKRPPAVVLEQDVAGAHRGDVEIGVAVVVDVGERGRDADLAGDGDAGGRGDVLELAAADVLPQLVAADLVRKVDVQEAVAVDVGDREAVAVVVVHGLVGLARVVDDAMAERDAAVGNAVGELEITEHRRRRRCLHLLVAAAPEPGDALEVIGDVARRWIPSRLCRRRLRRRWSDYAENLVDELRGLPFETWLLDRVLAHAAGQPVVEVGSGPGHVTAYLSDGGADATGIDVSPAMVAEARRRFPGPTFEVGDLRRLSRPATSWGWAAVLGWYSLIHLAASEVPDAVAALVRPLDPGGLLVLGMQAGAEIRHRDEWFGHEVRLDFVRHEPAFVVGVVEGAGLVDIEWYLRGPVTALGETSQRLYVVGRKPA